MSRPRLPDPRERPWVTVAELAAITSEGEKAIRAAVDAGQIPSLRIGRYVRIPTARLLDQLGMPTDMSEAGPSSPATATDTTNAEVDRDDRHSQHAPNLRAVNGAAPPRRPRGLRPPAP